MSELFRRLASLAGKQPDRLAIACGDDAMTYRALHDEALAFAELFGSQRSPLVILAVPGGPRFLAAELGAIAAGAVVLPVSEKTTKHEMAGVLALVSPDVIVVESESAQASILAALTADDRPAVVITGPSSAVVRPTPARERSLPPGTCLIQLTSGSTGRPKGICITEANLVANQDANAAHLASFGDAPVFCPVPQFHAMGGAVVLEHVLSGRGAIVTNKFVPGDDVRRMKENAVGAILGSPSYCRLMLKLRVLAPSHLPDLRSITLGTAAIDAGLVAELQAAFPDLRIHLRYGLSESVGAMTRLDLAPGESLGEAGLVGPLVNGTLGAQLPPPGDGEPQEIVVASSCNAPGQLVERGAWQPLTDGAGLLATGDMGFADALGRIHVRGRKSAFLKVNGYRINPFELEEALRTLPGVQEAVVVGPPHPVSGQRIVACLEQGPGPRIFEPPALLTACRELLAPYKHPHAFVVFASLPRTPAGKPDRPRILEEASRHG